MSNPLEDIQFERSVNQLRSFYEELMEWFQKNYPEGRMRLDVNSDQRIGAMHYTLAVFTGKEATPFNQGLWKHKVSWLKEDFINKRKVDNFCYQWENLYRQVITTKMNTFYQAEKERVASL